MALKTFKPTSPGRRNLVLVDRSGLHKGPPVKKLCEGLSRSGGRNNLGRITARHVGGRARRLYRRIDFKRRKWGVEATVSRIEYDPNRTAFIALIAYADGEQSYILAPQRLAEGDTVIADRSVDIRPGNASLLRHIPVGTLVHNVEMKPGKGAQIARAAGTSVQIAGRASGYVQVKLSSGELRLIPDDCMATIGAVSNPDNMNTVLAKAGRKRWMGKRPTVRGVVMNPFDHPHGGGEGRSSGGRHPSTPWGKKTRGPKTRNNKVTDRLIIRRRRKRK